MFLDILNNYNWEEIKKDIYSKTKKDIEEALSKETITLEDFKALLSPLAKDYIEILAQKSNFITTKRFGKNIQMYIPLYLSNECQNNCTYCGFSIDNKIKRKTLSDTEILKEINHIKNFGFSNILLVTGESNNVNINYLLNAVKLIKPFFENITIEVQPLKEGEYKLLYENGVNGVYIYQETYNKETYKSYHLKGKKSNFENRINTIDYIGKSNMNKIGIGVLYGLEDFRVDAFFTALHLKYLEKKYWQTKYSISFPRLRPNASDFKQIIFLEDIDMLQLICAFRLLSNEVELSLSTRESKEFRDNLFRLGITNVSAGSKTNPGGYTLEEDSLEQFEISDERNPFEVAKAIEEKGYQPVWKDWDSFLM